jgi:CheY-like chemotaxis protein
MASILVSEADPDVRRLLAVLLTRLGHEAIVLGGGFDTPPPADLLLLEPAAPECLEQAWLVRLYDPTIPVVCVSVLPEEATFLRVGPLGYLTKPFTLEQLGDVIDRALAPACR